jgi:hypothetical protein
MLHKGDAARNEGRYASQFVQLHGSENNGHQIMTALKIMSIRVRGPLGEVEVPHISNMYLMKCQFEHFEIIWR